MPAAWFARYSRPFEEYRLPAYARRAGIEGRISQGVHTGDLRRSRYIGEVKTRLMHLLVAAALNFMRVAAWLAELPRSRTRQSALPHVPERPANSSLLREWSPTASAQRRTQAMRSLHQE